MSNRPVDTSRRRFLRTSLMGVAAVPVAATLFRPHSASAQDMPRLEESDPAAQGLNYRHDASAVTSGARQEGAICANCQLYQGSADAEWGPCAAFPGKLVNANGWCSAWVQAG